MWFPSHVILYCWLNGTAHPGSLCVLKLNLHRLHCEAILTGSRTAALLIVSRVAFHHSPLHPSVREAANSGAACWSSGFEPCVPGENSSAQSPHRQSKGTLFPTGVHQLNPVLFLTSLWDSQTFFSLWTDIFSHWFYFSPKVWVTLFYRILSFVLVNVCSIHTTNCKTKITEYNKNTFL